MIKKGEMTMKQKVINEVMQEMLGSINNAQLERLQEVLEHALFHKEITETDQSSENGTTNMQLLESFLSSKRIEGCSEKSLTYYKTTIETMLAKVEKNVREMATDDLREYLTEYQEKKQSSKVTVDNIRRILSSFFSWLEDEDYILKSPVRRIHKVKTASTIKETYTDEALEKMRDNCCESRDLALIDMLASTGMRVGELVLLNRGDINFAERECVVFGKGSKERMVYFDARTKIHLQKYLQERTDENQALFVTLRAPYDRLKIGGVESRLRELGKRLNIPRVHPHKFRRTLATMAIDKGMPIEQLQQLLGHKRIDTTLQYAMVKQSNVKIAHRKYIG
jgi:site-specific recombinase XerD